MATSSLESNLEADDPKALSVSPPPPSPSVTMQSQGEATMKETPKVSEVTRDHPARTTVTHNITEAQPPRPPFQNLEQDRPLRHRCQSRLHKKPDPEHPPQIRNRTPLPACHHSHLSSPETRASRILLRYQVPHRFRLQEQVHWCRGGGSGMAAGDELGDSPSGHNVHLHELEARDAACASGAVEGFLAADAVQNGG